MTITKPQIEGKKLNGQRGFSLLELLVVIAMSMAIAVTAVPGMVNAISSARMRGGMSSLTAFVMQTRGNSIRNNTFKANYVGFSASEYFVYQAPAAATVPAMSTAEELLPAGKQVVYMGTLTGSNAPSALDTGTAFGNSALTAANGPISWNTRGLPCLYGTGTGSAACVNKSFIWYFTFQPPWGSSRWAALSVSPAGRIKSWYWNGAAWTN